MSYLIIILQEKNPDILILEQSDNPVKRLNEIKHHYSGTINDPTYSLYQFESQYSLPILEQLQTVLRKHNLLAADGTIDYRRPRLFERLLKEFTKVY